jgi:hypothetical protein
MIAFLLLGIIPGTNFQINFTDWLLCTAEFVALILLYLVHKKRFNFGKIFKTNHNNSNRLTATRA